MKLHERAMQVQAAGAELQLLLIKFQQEHDLTNVEMLGLVNECQASTLKYMLRAERHPADPDRGADEE